MPPATPQPSQTVPVEGGSVGNAERAAEYLQRVRQIAKRGALPGSENWKGSLRGGTRTSDLRVTF